MKKKLFLGMAALLGMSLAFTACSNDDDPAGAAVNDNAIGFSVLTNNAAGTRATAITPENYKTQMTTFKVWGYYYDGGDYYLGTLGGNGGIVFNGSNGEFDYAQSTDLTYWPNDGKTLNFYAISPATNDNFAWDASGQLKYTVPTDQSEQIDLMQAHTENVSKPANGKADLKFKHLLSQVLFKAKSASSKIEAEIKSITIHKVRGGGFFQPKDTKIPDGYTTTSFWEDGGDYVDYAVGLTNSVTVTYENSKDKSVDATDADGMLMLIPQQLKGKPAGTTIVDANTNNLTYIEVEAKIISHGEKDTYLLGSATEYGKTYIGLGTKWEAGKKYIYTLVFGGKDGGGENPDGKPTLTPIGFEVVVTDWSNAWAEDSTEGDINL